jgi:hypothetical protein
MTVHISSCSSKRVLPGGMASVIIHSIVQLMLADRPLSVLAERPYVRILQICREEDGTSSEYAGVFEQTISHWH